MHIQLTGMPAGLISKDRNTMKNRIDELFECRKRNIVSIFLTAGYPGVNDTLSILKYLQQAGAGMVEIGIPFSDPLADGPTIQKSSHAAISNGMTLKKVAWRAFCYAKLYSHTCVVNGLS